MPWMHILGGMRRRSWVEEGELTEYKARADHDGWLAGLCSLGCHSERADWPWGDGATGSTAQVKRWSLNMLPSRPLACLQPSTGDAIHVFASLACPFPLVVHQMQLVITVLARFG